MKARVIVRPRPEILDPQGKAICETLGKIGFSQVLAVRAGKSFDLELDTEDPKVAGELLDAICQKLLANPLIESYDVAVEAG